MSTATTTVGKFVWHEHVSTEPAKAQEFYGQLFGWEFEVFKPGEFDYPMISSGGQMHGGFPPVPEGTPEAALMGRDTAATSAERSPLPAPCARSPPPTAAR